MIDADVKVMWANVKDGARETTFPERKIISQTF
jgi:hypothetical protein